MKKTISTILLSAVALTVGTTAKAEPVCPDSTGFKFTDVKVLKRSTPVKDQNKSGTCWCFSTNSFLEDEILRLGGEELHLSEMFPVRKCYEDKADKYIRMDGKINFAQGGSALDPLYVWRLYGAMPEEAYTGLNYGEEKHSHYEMADGLTGFLNGVLNNSGKGNTTAWKKAFCSILDSYLGVTPEKFTYKGKTYTPKEFAASLPINPDDYISLTSWTHHPFYTSFAVEVADNWIWAQSLNLPLDEFKAVVDNAVENGFPIAWSADVSEPGFKWTEGYAVLPAGKEVADMTDAEVARWTKLSDKDREKEKNEVKGPGKEKEVTQESRQADFDAHRTTDDHGMEIVGYATDQNGTRYYKVKNSWDTNQIYDGYFYVSEAYFKAKTMGILVHKDAIPAAIAKKLGLKK